MSPVLLIGMHIVRHMIIKFVFFKTCFYELGCIWNSASLACMNHYSTAVSKPPTSAYHSCTKTRISTPQAQPIALVDVLV